ncbi:MAG: PorP/SprF family type IX secretion system membrane protein [Bacteroidota bacterium]
MKTRLRTKTLSFLLFFLFSVSLSAQDIHWSQFTNSPLNLSPALTGVHRGDVRFSANYRNQWKNVPVHYMTFAGGADMKFFNKNDDNGFFAGGLIFDYDRAGDSELSWTKLGLNGSYTRGLNLKNFLTFGAQLGLNQRAFSTQNLRFDNQWDGEIFNPTLGSKETFDGTTRGFFDFSAGLNYHFQAQTAYTPRTDKSDRNRLDLGVALFHINQPNVSFYEEDEHNLAARWSAYGKAILAIAEKFDLALLGLYQNQNPHEEIVVGGGLKLHLVQDPYGNHFYERALQFGVNYRISKELEDGLWGDAIIPNIELHYGPWLFGASYDFTLSQFQTGTIGRRGGPEFSLIYILTKPKLPIYKACQIF